MARTLLRVKYWESSLTISAKPGGVGTASQRLIPNGGTTWIVDVHRDGKRLIVLADEKLTAFVEGSAQRESSVLAANTQRVAIARAFTKARTERSICFAVVAQSQTLIRMTALPCQVEPPHQHSPEL